MFKNEKLNGIVNAMPVCKEKLDLMMIFGVLDKIREVGVVDLEEFVNDLQVVIK